MWGYGGGGAGGVEITDEVQFFADLPDPTLNPAEYWIVRESSGLWIVNRKEKGMYHSDGVSWTRLGEWQQAFSDANFEIYSSGDNTKKYKTSLTHLPTATTFMIETKSENVITVAKVGGDFSSVKDAIESISGNTSTNRFVINVAPGVYTIDNSLGPIQLKAFCTVVAIGMRTVIMEPSDPNQDLFLGENFARVIGIVFSSAVGTGYILRHQVAGNMLVKESVLRDCNNGFISTHASGVLEIDALAINNPLGQTTAIGIRVENGLANLNNVIARTGSKVTTVISVTGATTQVNVHNFLAVSINLTTAIECLDGCRVVGVGNIIGFCFDGLVVSGNNTTVEFDAIKIQSCQNDGFRIDNIGTGIKLSLFATTVIDCANLNFNILNPNSETSGNGFTELSNSFIVAGAEFNAYLLDLTEGDEGLNVFGELHVGSPIRPTESVFGGGDSYTNGMIVYTETDLGVFVDVSTEAKSISASTFTFPGVIVDNAIYVSSILNTGSDFLEHFGIKTLINTAAVKGAGSIIAEYWNGSSWVEVEAMEVGSSGQYLPHANDYFSHIGGHHIRYNSQLAVDAWTKNDPMSLGTSYYWVRFRIDSTITTAPVFEQFKLHTNRSEINADGWIEYFGKARPIGQLGLNFSAAKPFEGNLLSQTIYVNEDVGVGFTQNRFTATGDKSGIAGFLPFDFDTSSPLVLQWSGRASASQTIEWTIRVYWVTDNGSDLYYTSEPALLPGRKVVIISKAITLNQVSMFEASIDVKEMLSRRDGAFGDEIWVSIQPSVLSGTFDLVSSQATYTRWCLGGHI